MSENSFDRFPPGFAAKRYRATLEEIERNIRESEIQIERQKRYRKKMIEEGLLPPDPKSDEEKA
jgi:hypothetical protein